MPFRSLPAYLCITLLLGIPVCMLSATEPKRIASIEGITEYRFENGLRLLLFPDQSRPTVTVNLTVFVGSRHEGYGESGMAHLLEHMLFKGTPGHPNVPKVLQERGARFNGTTWLDRTNYYETLPASDENLEFALRLEADRMMNSFVRAEDLASEMTVVRNEFERGENSVQSILQQRMTAVAYEWHNYGKSTIGNRSDIERVPITNLREFYRRFYQPDNAMVVVAGQFDEDKSLELVQKYFGTIPAPERQLDRTYTEEPEQDGERTVVLRRVGDTQMVGVAYHIPSGPHPEYAAVEVLSYILATEPAGRLYKALVETKKASQIVGWSYSLHDPGLMMMTAEAREGDSLDDLRDTMVSEIERIGTEGVTDEEVERVKQQILSQRERSLSDTSSVAVQLSEWAAQGDWRLYFLFRDRIEQVTASDVQEVAAKYLRRNNRTVGTFIPTEEPQRVEIPATPDIAEMVRGYEGREVVSAGEQFAATPDNIESRTTRSELPNGLKLALLPKKTRAEAVRIQLTLRYGTPETLVGKRAAMELLPRLMARGTKQLTYQQLQDLLDQNRATVRASGSAGRAQFSIDTKRPYLRTVLDLLGQILREPTLPAEELAVLRREQLARLDQRKTDPQFLAFRQLQRTISPYPESHVRYTPTIPEEIELFSALRIDDVRSVYDTFLAAGHGELVMVGDFDIAEVQPLLDEMVGHWTNEQAYARIPQRAFTEVPGGSDAILTPDKANAFYGAGMSIAIKDTDPDYAGLMIGNFLFGGGTLRSRLGDRVRQQEGLSYGVRSQFSAASHDSYGALFIMAISNPDNTPKVVKAIREEFDLLLEKGIGEEELEQAKQGYLQRAQLNRTQDGALAAVLSNTLYDERTMEYYADLEQQIAELSADEVLASLRRHFDPERLIVVTAGDFEKE